MKATAKTKTKAAPKPSTAADLDRLTPLDLADLAGADYAGASWSTWRTILRAAFALPTSAAERAALVELTGRSAPPAEPVRELWVAAGRRSGKSRIAALVAAYLATCREYKLAPGERPVLAVLAATTRQAAVIFEYIAGIFEAVPPLAALVAGRTAETLVLTNGVTIEVTAADSATVRGRTLVGAVCDEVAFWDTGDTAADPDAEILRAIRPALVTTGGLLVCVSSPYAREGELFNAYQRHFGNDSSDVLVVKAPTRVLNPTIDPAEIERALAEDPSSAAAEWQGEFRLDRESFVALELVDAAIVRPCADLPFSDDAAPYIAFCDPAGGGGADSMTLAIAHAVPTLIGAALVPVAVVDLVREAVPPFSPEEIVSQWAPLLASYGIAEIIGDAYAGTWPAEAFGRHGIAYILAGHPKRMIYTAFLPLLTSRRAELPDAPKLRRQLSALERRPGASGRDEIDHPRNGHDDVINAVAGVCVRLVEDLVDERKKLRSAVWGRARQRSALATRWALSRADRAIGRERAVAVREMLDLDRHPRAFDRLRKN